MPVKRKSTEYINRKHKTGLSADLARLTEALDTLQASRQRRQRRPAADLLDDAMRPFVEALHGDKATVRETEGQGAAMTPDTPAARFAIADDAARMDAKRQALNISPTTHATLLSLVGDDMTEAAYSAALADVGTVKAMTTDEHNALFDQAVQVAGLPEKVAEYLSKKLGTGYERVILTLADANVFGASIKSHHPKRKPPATISDPVFGDVKPS